LQVLVQFGGKILAKNFENSNFIGGINFSKLHVFRNLYFFDRPTLIFQSLTIAKCVFSKLQLNRSTSS